MEHKGEIKETERRTQEWNKYIRKNMDKHKERSKKWNEWRDKELI